MIGCHEESSCEGGFESVDQLREALRRLEVAAIQDETRGARVAEHTDVGVRQIGPDDADHQALTDEIGQLGHAIDSSNGPAGGPGSGDFVCNFWKYCQQADGARGPPRGEVGF